MSSDSSSRSLGALFTTLILGTASAGLYILMFAYSHKLPALAAATREGETLYAVVPVLIAMVFSLVHGAFTAHFWDLLGLRAKK
jgi:hypothetical protein